MDSGPTSMLMERPRAREQMVEKVGSVQVCPIRMLPSGVT